MAKNVLIISASPRKGGNSDILCDRFMAGTKETGHNTEKIFLKEKHINYCTGCGACFNGAKPCPQKDDMEEILHKMIKADVIVMATPIYFYTMNAQMKTLIDRTCARYLEISDKEFYYLLTAADDNREAMERTVDGFRGFTDCLHNPVEKGVIYGTGVWKAGEVKTTPAFNQAYEMGKNV